MLTSKDRFSGSMIATAVSRSLLTRISADYERDEYLMDRMSMNALVPSSISDLQGETFT